MKILMTLMGLESGEAETHVTELSKALVRAGHEVTVASNGGALVKELESSSIPHVKLPLHTKNPFAVAKSYFALKKLIENEDFDIVHAHARIPAFICGELQKRLKFRFVTSAHWAFKVNPLYKIASNWGEHCVAVSDDIQQYVIDNYGICADNISVTASGTDNENCSSEQLAKDYIEAYKKLLPYEYYKHGDIVISGYYGYGNTGDDSLLLSIIENLRAKDPSVKITVITRSPKKMSARFGVRAISRIDLFAIIGELSHAKLLISGGGSILQNSSSNRSLIYYTSIIALAKRLGARVMLYSNGIGPLIGDAARKRAKKAIERADAITLREPSSKEELTALGIDKEKARISADPALLLSPADERRIKSISIAAGIAEDKRYFAVSLREWKKLRNLADRNADDDFEKTLAEALDEISHRTGAHPIFIPMQPSHDTAICERVRGLCRSDSAMLSNLTAKELMGIIEKTDFVIGMRLHILIYATAVGVPVLGLSYDPKIDAFLDYSGQPKALDVRYVKKDDIVTALTEITEDHDSIKTEIEAKCKELCALAELDAATAIELVNKK